ncbi:MAG: hypothetical protein IJG63_08415 [Oscillospiraceae bacterium]|nr:hypothetical protein [Oscillospiraceae bacterium]
MKKITETDKLSKKKKREVFAKRRGDWQGLNPVTRVSKNGKAYDRKKQEKPEKDAYDEAVSQYGGSGRR